MSAVLVPLSTFAQYIASFFFICCLPGLALSYLLFPPARLDRLERVWIACFSSIALSSLLASGLIIILGQFSPLYFFAGIVILTVGFASAAVGRSYQIKNEHTGLSVISFSLGVKSNKSLLLVVVLFVFFLIALRIEIPGISNEVDILPASIPSSITEFFISPQDVELVLESIKYPQTPIIIPLTIVNYSPEPKEFRIEIFMGKDKILEQSDVAVTARGVWQEPFIIFDNVLGHSESVNILLFERNVQEPISQLRLWP
jgi:uncharacterized membrane protein